jgi:hypothetical protein
MVTGDINKINLSISSFERMITDGLLYVDKTRMIENFLNTPSDVQLVARQRRLGKSLNMDMLKCFLTDKKDFRHLFKGLYIESNPVWSNAHNAPIFYFDFKRLSTTNYKKIIYDTVCEHIDSYCVGVKLSRSATRYMNSDDYNDPNGLLYLTESVFKATGKRSYILIDEYDKLLMDNYDTEKYNEISEFEISMLAAGLKGNEYLEKALLTGVMRISRESMFSGLNNIVTFDVFGDDVYTNDYGLTEEEIKALCDIKNFDIDEVRAWYNGIRIGGQAIYNIYSVMSYLALGKLNCYWGKSGTMDMITGLLNENRKSTLAKLLNGEKVKVEMDDRISLRHLSNNSGDQAFYSLLVQAGYLALDEAVLSKDTTATVSIPNTELIMVWKRFILSILFPDTPKIRTLFDHADNLALFSDDLEHFISDRLSYHDLAVHEGETKSRANERIYHVFLLGLLSAYDDVRCKYPLSNRESGDGRYDILIEKPTANFIFEFKASNSAENLEEKAQEALTQIEIKRYGADISAEKRLVRVGVAFHGKMCKVRCS